MNTFDLSLVVVFVVVVVVVMEVKQSHLLVRLSWSGLWDWDWSLTKQKQHHWVLTQGNLVLNLCSINENEFVENHFFKYLLIQEPLQIEI